MTTTCISVDLRGFFVVETLCFKLKWKLKVEYFSVRFGIFLVAFTKCSSIAATRYTRDRISSYSPLPRRDRGNGCTKQFTKQKVFNLLVSKV